MVRAERTGPTGSVPTEWNTATKRVMSASTTSSNTMSAWFSPDCGAASTLSTFTTSAGRGAITIPVSGCRGTVEQDALLER